MTKTKILIHYTRALREIFRFPKEISRHLSTLRTVRSGNKISRVGRIVINRFNIKAILGGNLAALVMLTGVIAPAQAELAEIEPELSTIEAQEAPIATEVQIQYPTDPVIFNQGYYFLHWGIDLDGVTGDPVRPIKNGRVISRQFSRWGFGNAILVEHEGGIRSFYAHLNKINVREGDEVDTRTVIGEVGSSGRSTGDHLHLEIYKNGRPVNPRTFLGR